jgi:hypothetical protein
VALLLAACADCSGHTQSKSTVQVTAVLTYEHPVDGHERVFHNPLSGHSVTALGASGQRTVATVNKDGLAVLSLPAGSWELTTSVGQVCAKRHIVLAASTTRSVHLTCVAP